MQNTRIADNNRGSHQTPLDLELNVPDRSYADNPAVASPHNQQSLSKGAFDMYQTLIDLQHGNDQMKRKSTPSPSGVDAVGL